MGCFYNIPDPMRKYKHYIEYLEKQLQKLEKLKDQVPTDIKQKIQDMEDEIQNIINKINDIQNQDIEQLKSKITDLQNSIQSINGDITNIKNQIQNILNTIDSLKNKLSSGSIFKPIAYIKIVSQEDISGYPVRVDLSEVIKQYGRGCYVPWYFGLFQYAYENSDGTLVTDHTKWDSNYMWIKVDLCKGTITIPIWEGYTDLATLNIFDFYWDFATQGYKGWEGWDDSGACDVSIDGISNGALKYHVGANRGGIRYTGYNLSNKDKYLIEMCIKSNVFGYGVGQVGSGQPPKPQYIGTILFSKGILIWNETTDKSYAQDNFSSELKSGEWYIQGFGKYGNYVYAVLNYEIKAKASNVDLSELDYIGTDAISTLHDYYVRWVRVRKFTPNQPKVQVIIS